MNHLVPDFETGDDWSPSTSTVQLGFKKSSMPDDEVMELLWQNGQVVMQSQTQKSARKSPPSSKFDATIPADQIAIRDIQPLHQEEEPQLFMQEDEMASWLHYPLVDDPSLDHNLCAELLYPTPPQSIDQNASSTAQIPTPHGMEFRPSTLVTSTETSTAIARPPIPPTTRTEPETRENNLLPFSRQKRRVESGPSSSKNVVRERTVVDSNDTTGLRPESTASELWRTAIADASNSDLARRIMSSSGVAVTSRGDGAGLKEMIAGETTLTSSTGCSSTSAEPATEKTAVEDRKRKGKEQDDTECHSTDVEFESTDAQKRVRGSTSTKRSRAAEVHNLSERRRRDRINEKMKALQELIPRCNKADKASMLDEAIEYLKSLQLQVQMMSMGCGMMPMMFPGVQQFMPPMAMGLGMGMGMEMSVNRPMMPYPNMLASSTFSMPAGAAHFGPSFSFPSFPMVHVPNTDPSRFQGTNQSDHTHSSLRTQNINQPRASTSLDAYQQFLGSQQMQVPVVAVPRPAPQNQPAALPGTDIQCASRGLESTDNYQPGRD